MHLMSNVDENRFPLDIYTDIRKKELPFTIEFNIRRKRLEICKSPVDQQILILKKFI